jgi:hypothetical protein
VQAPASEAGGCGRPPSVCAFGCDAAALDVPHAFSTSLSEAAAMLRLSAGAAAASPCATAVGATSSGVNTSVRRHPKSPFAVFIGAASAEEEAVVAGRGLAGGEVAGRGVCVSFRSHHVALPLPPPHPPLLLLLLLLLLLQPQQ